MEREGGGGGRESRFWRRLGWCLLLLFSIARAARLDAFHETMSTGSSIGAQEHQSGGGLAGDSRGIAAPLRRLCNYSGTLQTAWRSLRRGRSHRRGVPLGCWRRPVCSVDDLRDPRWRRPMYPLRCSAYSRHLGNRTHSHQLPVLHDASCGRVEEKICGNMENKVSNFLSISQFLPNKGRLIYIGRMQWLLIVSK